MCFAERALVPQLDDSSGARPSVHYAQYGLCMVWIMHNVCVMHIVSGMHSMWGVAGQHLLDENFPQAALPKGVVLEVEAVKSVEGLLAGMHVQGVHIQVIPAVDWHNISMYGLQEF